MQCVGAAGAQPLIPSSEPEDHEAALGQVGVGL